MQLIVLLTVALQESTERREYYSLRASSPFLKFWGSREKSHESRIRKEMLVRSLTARRLRVLWGILQSGESLQGGVRLGNEAEGKLG